MLAFGSRGPFLLVFGPCRVDGGPAWRSRPSDVQLAALAYSLKFLWSPVIDGVDVPVLSRLVGRRRAWMIVCQALIAVGLVGMGLSGPTVNIVLLAVFTFLVGFGSATQDVVIDGWRIDAARSRSRGSWRGLPLGSACVLLPCRALYSRVCAASVVPAMAALMAVGLVACLLSPIVDRSPEGEAAARRGFDFVRGIKEPLIDLYRRLGPTLFPILVMVALYRLPDFVAGVMANPLYVDLGFSKTDSPTRNIYGVWMGIRLVAGGYLVLARPSTTCFIGAFSGGLERMYSACSTRARASSSVSDRVDNFRRVSLGTEWSRTVMLTAPVRSQQYARGSRSTRAVESSSVSPLHRDLDGLSRSSRDGAVDSGGDFVLGFRGRS